MSKFTIAIKKLEENRKFTDQCIVRMCGVADKQSVFYNIKITIT